MFSVWAVSTYIGVQEFYKYETCEASQYMGFLVGPALIKLVFACVGFWGRGGGTNITHLGVLYALTTHWQL